MERARTVRRAVAGAALAAMVAASAEARATYRSEEHRFLVATPSDWSVEPDSSGKPLRLRTASKKDPRFHCTILVYPNSATRAASQAEIDARLTQAGAEAMVRRDIVGVSATIRSLRVYLVERNRHPASMAEAVLVVGDAAYRFHRLDMHRPGRHYSVRCIGPEGPVTPLSNEHLSVMLSFAVF